MRCSRGCHGRGPEEVFGLLPGRLRGAWDGARDGGHSGVVRGRRETYDRRRDQDHTEGNSDRDFPSDVFV